MLKHWFQAADPAKWCKLAPDDWSIIPTASSAGYACAPRIGRIGWEPVFKLMSEGTFVFEAAEASD